MNSLKSVHTKAYTQNLNDFLKAHFLRIFPVEKEFHQSVQITVSRSFFKNTHFLQISNVINKNNSNFGKCGHRLPLLTRELTKFACNLQ